MKVSFGTLAGCILALVVIVVLAVADARMFEDAEVSPLYQSTLDAAYNRFKASDKHVPAGAPDDVGIEFANEQSQPAGRRPGPQRANQARPRARPPAMPRAAATPAAGATPATHDHNSVHMTQGVQYARERKYDLAAAEFRLELQDSPRCALAHHRLADVLKTQGKPDEAVAEYKKTLECRDSYYCVYTHMGEILLSQNKTEEAESAFSKAIAGYRKQIDAGGPQAPSWRYQLAKLYLDRKQNVNEAVQLAETAAAERPTEAIYLHLLAQCYEAVGRNDEALAALGKAIKLEPSRAVFYQAFRNRLTGTPSLPATRPAGGTSP